MSGRLVAVFTPFEDLTDPRIERTRVHDLFELVVVALCGTLAGADTWADIERFGNDRLTWLRTFLVLEGGIASHDTFGRVFAMLDPAELMGCIGQWLDDLGREIGKHIAIDGKTLRGSGDKAAARNPLHLVSACCQKEIAQKIVSGGGDYVLALKGNHETLHQAVDRAFTAALEADARPSGMTRHVTSETNRGRRERREYTVLPVPSSLPGSTDWKGLATLVMVLRITQANGQEMGQVSYFLTSLPSKVKTLAKVIRQHWSIESSLHWVLDVTFSEDKSRIRKQHAPQTSAMLRRLAVSILQADTSVKDTIRGKRYRACLNTNTLERILLSFAAN